MTTTTTAEYQAFVELYTPGYQEAQFQIGRNGTLTLTPESCFVQRFWLTYDFQPFPCKDLNLPRALLPEDWVSFAARDLFTNYRQLLNLRMGGFIDTIVRGGEA